MNNRIINVGPINDDIATLLSYVKNQHDYLVGVSTSIDEVLFNGIVVVRNLNSPHYDTIYHVLSAMAGRDDLYEGFEENGHILANGLDLNLLWRSFVHYFNQFEILNNVSGAAVVEGEIYLAVEVGR